MLQQSWTINTTLALRQGLPGFSFLYSCHCHCHSRCLHQTRRDVDSTLLQVVHCLRRSLTWATLCWAQRFRSLQRSLRFPIGPTAPPSRGGSKPGSTLALLARPLGGEVIITPSRSPGPCLSSAHPRCISLSPISPSLPSLSLSLLLKRRRRTTVLSLSPSFQRSQRTARTHTPAPSRRSTRSQTVAIVLRSTRLPALLQS